MAKRVFVVFLALLTLTSVYSITRANVPVAKAAAPTTLNFQARLLNTSGSLVNDGTYNVEFKIYNASSSSGSSQGACTGDANCLWTETRTGANKVQVKNGYLSAYLGDISALPTNIWNQQLYLTMNIGGTGAASWDGEMTPRIRLTSVPYAFRATIAESAEALSKNTGSFTGTVEFATMTADRKYLFPDTSLATTASPGTICVYNGAASNCPAASGSAYYLQNDTILQTQTNFHIQARDSGANGTIGGVITAAANGQTVDLLQFRASNDSTVLAAVTAAGNLQVASSLDTRTAGTLSVGTSTASAVSIGKSGAATTVNGQLAVTEAFSANGGATITGTTNINTTGTAVTTIGNSGAGVVLNGAVTVNEAATFNQNVVVAAEKTIRFVGGTTAQRPASPSEGMLYFDTTTKQLLTYANGKWQADRSTATKIVAASNSSQAVKDSADYVADGTGDQVEINAALTAAAGGKVYLAEGTYVANATILVPNNTVLVGSGRGTLIELADLDATDNLIENSDTSTGTGVRIQDLRIDGRNDLNTAGTQYGIYLSGMGGGTGASARQGGLISGVTANNFRSYGIFLTASSNNLLTQNRTQGNTGGGIGLDAGANYNTLTGNTVQGSVYGVVVATSGNTITGNNIQGHTNSGIYLISANNNTITGNSVNGNSVFGVALTANSNTNTVVGNKFYDNGGAATNNSVYLSGSDSNTITANNISDTSATTTNYAINIFDSTSDTNYLSDNLLAGSGINDAGTGTVYGGQANSSGNFLIQPTGTIELLKNTNVTGTLNITGNVDTNGSLTVGNADQFVISNTGVVTSGTWNGTALTDTYVADALTISSSGSVDWTALTGYPGACTAGSAVTQIADTLTCTAFATGTAGSYIQNQSASAQTTSNFWISGTGRADTSFLAPTFDIATAATLNIGTTNATALSVSKSGVTTTVNGALTVTEAGTFNGGLTSAGNFTVTSAGNVAFQRNTTDYTATGTQNDINFGTGALFRITSASALTITSIAGGADGRVITLANASSNTVTIQNDSGGTAANRIITGTGVSLSVPAGSTVQLAYDSSSSRWRVIGGIATSGGGANQQLSNLSGTVAVNASLNPYDTNVIDLGSSSYSWRTLYADTSVLTPRVDTDGAATLLLGNTNATAITLGRSGVTTTNAGALTVSELLTANAGITASGGALSLTGNAASSLTTSSGALTITSAAAATWSTAAGNLTVDSAATLNLGTTNATAVSISKTGVITTVNGALTVTQAGQFNGGLTVASDLTVTNAGNVAFQRNTTDITTTGTLNDVNLGTGVMFRLNGASTQTVTSIAGGTDGRIITIVNAAAQQALFNNDSCSGCTASNRIVTGTNGALALPPGGSILLGYDTGASRWRIIGGTAVSGGGANRQLNNLQGTVAVNASLTTGVDNTIDLGSNSFSWRTLYADTSVLTPTVDTDSAVALNIGTTNATNITIGHNAGTFAVDGTNFDLATNGVMTLAGGQTADITTQANQNLTVQANGTGTIVLNDTVTVAGTQTFSGVTTDITTGTNEDLTIDANGTGLLQLSDSVVVAAQQTIRFVGGTTAQRPASPGEGMMYFDTDTDKLLIYSNGKWQADRLDVTKTVAPSNAAQQIKDSADYVATGTSDQTTINAALTAAAGGRVYLFEGTFTTDDAISVPNNTVLAGSGAGTLIQFANIAGQTKNMITNTDTTTGTGVTVRDLKLDGNDGVNTTGTMTGIFFNGLGGYGTERRGALIQGVTAQNFLTQGIRLENSVQSIVTGTTANNNGGSGMFLQSSSHNTITGNTASGNGVNGIGLNASSNNTVTANTTSNNTQSGLSVASSSNHNAIDGNTSYANGGIGISLTTSSSHNTVSTNTSNANGSNGISLNAAHNNSLVGNTSSNNTLNGIGLTSANQNTLTGDTTSGNGTNGISLSGSSRNTITGSSISSNLAGGTQLVSTSDDNVVSSGVLYDNGGSGAVSSITVTSSSNNQIIGNRITDTAGTAYAINISNAGANTNYLAGNTFSGTGATTINDAGTGTIFAGQIKDSSNGNYFIQPAGTVELMKNTNVTGTLTASVAVQAPVFDTASAVALAIGNTNATAITLGRSGITTTNAGALTVTQLLTANAGITASGGALSLTGNAASSLTTSSGALTITSAAAATWSTAAGNLTVDSAAALQLGTGTATSLSVSRTGVTTTVNGALTVTQAGTFNGGLSVASDFTVTNAGNVAFQRNTTDFTTTGTSNDVNLGTGVLFRLNGATAQTITSIAGGVDGRVITLINAAANDATIQNDSGGTAANRIITGTGGSLTVPTGASIQLAYDSSASRWRVIGGSAVAGGGANQQLSNLSGTIAINASLLTNDDNVKDLGSTANSWRTLYADTSVLTSRVDRAAAATLNIGTVTANAISISKSGTTTTVNGALTVTELGTFNGGFTVASNLTVTPAGNVAFQRNTTDYSSTGTQNDVNFGTGALFRITSASALTVTSIAGGADGRLITLINASANEVTLQNDSGGTAANRILTGTGANIVIPAGASLTLAYDSSSSRWRVIGSTAGANGYIQLQSSTPGTPQTGNFNISGTGLAATSLLTPTLDTPSGTTTLNIGTTNATAGINLNQNTQITGNLTLAQGANRTVSVGTRSTAGTGYTLTVAAGAANGSNNAGGALLLQGGAAVAGNANGGGVTIAGGAGVGTGAQGLVALSTSAFTSLTLPSFGSDTSANALSAGAVDLYSSLAASATTSGRTLTINAPTITTLGRLLYVANVGSNDFNILLSGTSITISLKPNTTATLIWNGVGWTAAGASSSTDLQAAYNNTLTSAGGAELVLNAPGGAADGLTIRNNATTPIVGGLLEVQTSVGSNLLSVNSNATEYASNGGAESSTFTAWGAAPAGGTATRYTTAGNNIATGQASVFADTTSTANTGIKNTLGSSLTQNLKYKVSYTVRNATSTPTFAKLDTIYSADGTATTATCASDKTSYFNVWTRIDCTFTATSVGASNAVIIRHSDAVEHDFYIDNLSVTVSADVNHAADGDADSAANIGGGTNNWAAVNSATVVQATSPVYNTGGAVSVTTSATAGRGVYNKLSNNIVPTNGTTYRVAFYARGDGTNTANLDVAYTPDNGTSTVACQDYNTQTAAAAAYTLISCYVTPSGSVTNAQIRITQSSGSATVFYVDALSVTLNSNTASNVQIGGANKGGPTTLITLDRSASAPIAANNDAYLGSMYYDTTTGRIQCYEADGWGACGSAPDVFVTLTPEYTGAVLNGNGVGVMTADFCANSAALTVGTLCGSNQSRQYYTWTSPQATEQIYSIFVSYKLPSTFKTFNSDDTINLTARTSNTTTGHVTYEVFKSTGSAITACGSATDVTNTTDGANFWSTKPINGNEATSCGFAAGDNVVFKINMKSYSNANVYVENLTFTYTNN